MICGNEEEEPFNENDYEEPENPPIAEFDGERIAQSERDMLLLQLFPSVANSFLRNWLQLKYDKIRSEEAEKYRIGMEKARKGVFSKLKNLFSKNNEITDQSKINRFMKERDSNEY